MQTKFVLQPETAFIESTFPAAWMAAATVSLMLRSGSVVKIEEAGTSYKAQGVYFILRNSLLFKWAQLSWAVVTLLRL